MSYHPEIKTIEEWNARMCGCCPMPYCLPPILDVRSSCVKANHFTYATSNGGQGIYDVRVEGRSVEGSSGSEGDTLVANFRLFETLTFSDENKVNRCGVLGQVDRSYEVGGTFTRTSSNLVVNGVLSDMAGMPDPRWSGGGQAPILPGPSFPMWTLTVTDFSGTNTVYRPEFYTSTQGDILTISFPTSWVTNKPNNGFSMPIDCQIVFDRIIDSSRDLLEANSLLKSSFRCDNTSGFNDAWLSRYRWSVPTCHPGSYFKITWDEVKYSKDYMEWLSDASFVSGFDPTQNPPPDLPIVVSREWEWLGDALGDCLPFDPYPEYLEDINNREQMESRKSPWVNLNPQLTADQENQNGFLYEAVYEIRNVKYSCYRSLYGNRPQIDLSFNQDNILDDLDQDGIPDNEEQNQQTEP